MIFCGAEAESCSEMSMLAALVVLVGVGLGVGAEAADDTYLIGAGRYDVTGPAAEIEMVCVCVCRNTGSAVVVSSLARFSLSCTQMGYAMPTQITHGIHFRQWSRAFIIADSANSNRVVFINVDICMGTQILKMQVSFQHQ